MQITEIKMSKHDSLRINSRSKTRVYVWPKGETLLENLQNRHNRPYVAMKPFALKAAEALSVVVDKLGWSQKAGCSCGCSPGFVVQGQHRPGFDIHVTLEA